MTKETLMEKINNLRGEFVNTYNQLTEFVDRNTINSAGKQFLRLSMYDVRIHEDVLKRKLSKQERKYIIGSRCTERLNHFYQWQKEIVAEYEINDTQPIYIPPMTDDARTDFVINWYQGHNLWINK